jgi:hypothetical protein
MYHGKTKTEIEEKIKGAEPIFVKNSEKLNVEKCAVLLLLLLLLRADQRMN